MEFRDYRKELMQESLDYQEKAEKEKDLITKAMYKGIALGLEKAEILSYRFAREFYHRLIKQLEEGNDDAPQAEVEKIL